MLHYIKNQTADNESLNFFRYTTTMIQKALLIFLYMGFVIGQIGRITTGYNISFTILDITVFVNVVYFLIKHYKNIKSLPLVFPFLVLIIMFSLSLFIHLFNYS